MNERNRIGVVGSGFIAKGFVLALDRREDMVVSGVLTRTNIDERADFPRQDLMTNSVDDLLERSDLIVECSGDVIHGTNVIDRAMEASLPVVTMDADLQIVTGSHFARRGFITEAAGDQPGCLAVLKEEAIEMGFRPLVYGNIKGFLNLNPARDDMEYWASKQDYSLAQQEARPSEYMHFFF